MVAWGPQGVGVQTAGAGVLGAGHEGADLLDFTKDAAAGAAAARTSPSSTSVPRARDLGIGMFTG